MQPASSQRVPRQHRMPGSWLPHPTLPAPPPPHPARTAHPVSPRARVAPPRSSSPRGTAAAPPPATHAARPLPPPPRLPAIAPLLSSPLPLPPPPSPPLRPPALLADGERPGRRTTPPPPAAPRNAQRAGPATPPSPRRPAPAPALSDASATAQARVAAAADARGGSAAHTACGWRQRGDHTPPACDYECGGQTSALGVGYLELLSSLVSIARRLARPPLARAFRRVARVLRPGRPGARAPQRPPGRLVAFSLSNGLHLGNTICSSLIFKHPRWTSFYFILFWATSRCAVTALCSRMSADHVAGGARCYGDIRC